MQILSLEVFFLFGLLTLKNLRKHKSVSEFCGEEQTVDANKKHLQTGCSFHIQEPYAFCKNVLPQYFKHNNLNSLIRQLNMCKCLFLS